MLPLVALAAMEAPDSPVDGSFSLLTVMLDCRENVINLLKTMRDAYTLPLGSKI